MLNNNSIRTIRVRRFHHLSIHNFRLYLGKKTAKIYDIIVLPPARSGLPTELIQLEKKIVAKEFKRYEEFAGIASNVIECIKKMEEVEDRLDL